MIVNKNFFKEQLGASIIEVIFAISIVIMLTPFVFKIINNITQNIKHLNTVKNIVNDKKNFVSFVKINQFQWSENIKIKLTDLEIETITDNKYKYVYIDKYTSNNIPIIDIFLIIDIKENLINKLKIIQQLGKEATIVDKNKQAKTNLWSISSDELSEGDIVYRISYVNNKLDDKKYLHRSSNEEADLNTMYRDLDINNHDIQNVNNLYVLDLFTNNIETDFLNIHKLYADNLYYKNGLELNGENAKIKNLYVNNDIIGFKNIYSNNIKINNKNQNSTIKKQLKIYEQLNVTSNLYINNNNYIDIKDINNFETATLKSKLLLIKNIDFDFGINVSSKNLIIGNWDYSKSDVPIIKNITINNMTIKDVIDLNRFDKILTNDWQN